MRSLLARLAVVGAFAVSVSACSGGNGTSLPYAGPPNAAGGNSGTLQSGSNGAALLRFIAGSPDVTPSVDVCVDKLPFGVTAPTVAYGMRSALYAIPGGIGHIVSVYPPLASGAGAECATAPAPYLGTVKALAVTTISPLVGARQTVVLGGTAATNTFGLYAFTEPSFAIAPAGGEAISHNAAPAFSSAPGSKTVGFGTCSTTVTPCVTAAALTGATGLAAPKLSGVASTTVNPTSSPAPLASVPAGFYDGVGVAAGTPTPVTSIAVGASAGQPYVVELYAIDAPAGGLNLIGFVEQTLGYGF